jgi:hypothetical protein
MLNNAVQNNLEGNNQKCKSIDFPFGLEIFDSVPAGLRYKQSHFKSKLGLEKSIKTRPNR